MAEPLQVWIRNDKGKVWGPLMPATLELLFDNQLIPGRVQVSTDGVSYVYPARMPEVRDHIPQDLWGDATAVPVPVREPEPAAPPAPATVIPGGPPVMRPGPAVSAPPPPPRRTNTAERAVPVPAAGAGAGLGDLPPRGDLTQASPLRLYYLAASSEVTGLLTLELADRAIQIHFRKGNPELIDSDHAEDALGAFLIKQGLANPAQLKQAEAEKARFGGELVPALFGLGLLNPGTAFQHLQTRASSILGKALMATNGRFTFVPQELAPSRAMPLGQRWGLAAEQVRRIPVPDLRRRIAEVFDLPVMKSGGKVPIGELRLTPQETRAAGYFDGVRSLAQLISDLPGEADTIVRVAVYLKEVDAVSFAGVVVPPREGGVEPPLEAEIAGELDAELDSSAAPTPPEAPAAPAPAPRAAVPPQAARPPPTIPGGPPKMAAPAAGPTAAPTAGPGARPAAGPPGGPPRMVPQPAGAARPPQPAQPAASTTRAPTGAGGAPVSSTKITQKAPVVQANADKPAGLDNTNDVIQLRAYAEKTRGQNLLEVLGVQKNVNAAQVKAAYFKLAKSFHPDTVPPGTPEEVGKLKAEIFGKIGEANRTLSDDAMRAEYIAEVEAGGVGEKVDVAAILAAEEMFQKGQILVKARKFPEAVKMLDDAIKGNPDEGEYYGWRGYAKFFLNTDKKAGHAEAMKDINVCVRKNPRVADVFYFQGNMAKLMGDLVTAKKFFKQCTDLNPQHLEAQRELRMMK